MPITLTLIATQVTGRSARQCIADFVIIEMKALLRNANVDIKELVKELGFRNQSALSRYFRRQTGMSPSEYRDSISDYGFRRPARIALSHWGRSLREYFLDEPGSRSRAVRFGWTVPCARTEFRSIRFARV